MKDLILFMIFGAIKIPIISSSLVTSCHSTNNGHTFFSFNWPPYLMSDSDNNEESLDGGVINGQDETPKKGTNFFKEEL